MLLFQYIITANDSSLNGDTSNCFIVFNKYFCNWYKRNQGRRQGRGINKRYIYTAHHPFFPLDISTILWVKGGNFGMYNRWLLLQKMISLYKLTYWLIAIFTTGLSYYEFLAKQIDWYTNIVNFKCWSINIFGVHLIATCPFFCDS